MYVYDDEHLRVIFDDRGGDTLLITFNEMDFVVSGRSYWSDKPAASLGVSCIGIVSKSKNWFPVLSMIEAKRSFSGILSRFKTIITYGFSQGAYGAIKYSKLCQSTHSLAFSPQWSIVPDQVDEFDGRFSQYFDPQHHQEMEIVDADIGGNIWVVFDPHLPQDAPHAYRIAETSERVGLVRCNFIGHGTVRAVASTEALKRLISFCELDEFNERELFRFIAQSKKNVFAYLYFMSRVAMKRNHIKWAEEFYKRAHFINDKHPYLIGWKGDLDILAQRNACKE